MKKLKLLALILSTALALSSCAISLRDESDSSRPVPTEVKTEASEPATSAVSSENVGSAAESTDEAPVIATQEVTESVSDTTAQKATEPIIAPTEPTEATYKPKALMYHLILEEVYGPYEKLFVRPSEFEVHLLTLDELGYEYLFADDWHLTTGPSVIVTLDDGYEDNYTEMFPILKAHGAKATVFLVTDLIGTDGYMTREMIREMSDSGLVSFQCHTAHHRDLSYMSDAELRAEFDESCSVIEEITGKPVRAIAYPAGSYNETVLSVASEYFDYAYTTKAPYNTPDYTELTVPRYYIARGYGKDMFLNFVKY